MTSMTEYAVNTPEPASPSTTTPRPTSAPDRQPACCATAEGPRRSIRAVASSPSSAEERQPKVLAPSPARPWTRPQPRLTGTLSPWLPRSSAAASPTWPEAQGQNLAPSNIDDAQSPGRHCHDVGTAPSPRVTPSVRWLSLARFCARSMEAARRPAVVNEMVRRARLCEDAIPVSHEGPDSVAGRMGGTPTCP